MTQKLCYTPPKINKDDDIHDAKHKNQDVKWADVECSPTISAVNLKKQPLNSRLPLYHYFQMDNQLGYKTRMTTSISSEAQKNQTSILIRERENNVSPKT